MLSGTKLSIFIIIDRDIIILVGPDFEIKSFF